MTEVPSPPIQRAGFVALIGRPNVGKSTLLNYLLGEKLSIVAPKPQTTRQRLLGVLTHENSQLAFWDTPGLHRTDERGHTLLNRFMVQEAQHVMMDADVLVWVTEPGSLEHPIRQADRDILAQIPPNKPLVLAVNKIDLLSDKQRVLPTLQAWSALHPFRAMVPLSAETGENVPALLDEIIACLPESEALFSTDTLTDRSERYLVAERIREQVFLYTHQEIPYATAVTIDQWEEIPSERGRCVRIDATIHIEKAAQKRIVVGAQGSMIKRIGSIARQEISQLLECPVQLFLFVRVDDSWSERDAGLREMGYV